MRTSEAEPGGGAPPHRLALLTLLVMAALGLLITLGVWQLHRLAWKQDMLARVERLQVAPASPLTGALQRLHAGEDVEFLRVVADCPGLDQAPYLKLMVVRDRVAGFRAISPCRVEDGPYEAILVDRGFVAQTDEVRLPPAAESPPHRPVVGVLRLPGRRSFVTPKDRPEQNMWYSRDAEAMADRLGLGAVAPVLLFLESPPPAGFGPSPAPLLVQFSNNHLGYAITWFGLAAALAGVYLAYVLKGRKV